jgi:phosphoglycerol transferase MdoB-like AlkP superfamily enzyme
MTSWIAEFITAPDTTEVSKELIELQKKSPDRLVTTEQSWPVGDKIVIIQLESLDYNVLNYKVNGQEVTPYFNQLARDSRLFKLLSYHDVGSADMDFATLSGGTPSSRMLSYMIPGLSYNNSLPRFLQQQGYNTVSWHGNNGSFFNRRTNFMRMGFTEVLFEEELNKQASLVNSYWGVRDKEIFRLSSEKMHATSGREFHFIITLDSHGPFDFISDQEKVIFPQSKQWQQNYFNSMHVLDRDVKKYLESLPAGTLVILYGDHTSGVNYGDYSSRNGSAEFVPCIVHVCKPMTSWPPHDKRQLSPLLVADLRVLDVINFFRRQVAPRP